MIQMDRMSQMNMWENKCSEVFEFVPSRGMVGWTTICTTISRDIFWVDTQKFSGNYFSWFHNVSLGLNDPVTL